jgi:two-component system LytT family response regulator
MYTAIIIEDEIALRETLLLQLQQLSTSFPIQVVATAATVSDAVEKINNLQPQLLFMDIELHGGTGFEVLEQVQPYPYKVIFTTAYSQYALKAFKYAAIDYLLKPFDQQDLKTALHKVLDNSATLSPQQIQIAADARNNHWKHLALSTTKGIHLVAIAEIIRAETTGSYTTFYLQGQKPVMVSRSLKEFDDILCPPQFFRIHHSHTIRIDALHFYAKEGIVTMKDGTQLPVAQRRREEFVALLKNK